jgi:hypothetical protein
MTFVFRYAVNWSRRRQTRTSALVQSLPNGSSGDMSTWLPTATEIAVLSNRNDFSPASDQVKFSRPSVRPSVYMKGKLSRSNTLAVRVDTPTVTTRRPFSYRSAQLPTVCRRDLILTVCSSPMDQSPGSEQNQSARSAKREWRFQPRGATFLLRSVSQEGGSEMDYPRRHRAPTSRSRPNR